ncbi:MAG TPA: hypothetical protein VM582_08395 [Candidatus Thermoplasmatota archaeon]|nr:hypothetical protein [Candidatus Thermoplasmatota archaeon]
MIAILPIAAASPGASLTLLGSEQACDSSYSSDSGGWGDEGSWYSYQSGHWAASCTDDFHYARANARDGRGSLATAQAGGSQGNSSHFSYGWTDSGDAYGAYHTDSWRWTQESGWSRGASADTRAGGAGVGYGCSSGWNDEGWSASSWSESSSSGSSSSARESFNACGARAATDLAGSDAALSAGDSCRSGQWSYSAGHDEGGSSYWYSSDVRRDSCARGAAVEAEGESASAGVGHACEWRDHGYGFSNGGPGGAYSVSDSRCLNGVWASGPDGIVLFAGYDAVSWTSCAQECDSYGWEGVGASLWWPHSPLSPDGTHVWWTLP